MINQVSAQTSQQNSHKSRAIAGSIADPMVGSVAKPKVWAFVPASGVGARMGAAVPKQYLRLGSEADAPTILAATLDRLAACPSISHLLLGIAAHDTHWASLNYTHPKLFAVTPGGEMRANTVLNGLAHIIESGGATDWVLVHDAVRPCVRVDEVEALIDTALTADQADRLDQAEPDGALLAVKVSDTMKRADDDGRTINTISREGMWRAMTPQLFKVGTLAQALNESLDAGLEATDESSAMERQGYRPQLVSCHADNIKITTADDLALASLILQAQQKT